MRGRAIALGIIGVAAAMVAWFLLSRVGIQPEAPADDKQSAGAAPGADMQAAPAGFFAAFTAGGPILIGLVADVKPAAAGEPVTKGDLIMEVEETLRGRDLPDTLELPFELRGADPRRPPTLWDRVSPRAGKRVCVILAPGKDPRLARCVLDLDGDDMALLPVLRRMLELEALPEGDRRSKLLAALADSAPWIRALAAELFLATEARADPRARSELLAALAPAARDRDRPLDERLQAVSITGLKVYDGFTADDPVNYEVLSFLAGLLTDPSSRVRGEAVHLLHGYLLGAGTLRPSAPRIQLGERERTIEQLKRDIEDRTYFAGAAGELLVLLTGG
jgi:hypothetical protein